MPAPGRLSVVIPVFNRRRMVVECLANVARQDRLPDLVLVVDDASTDGTAQVVSEWIDARADRDRWRLLTLAENVGAAAARNRGHHAAGEIDLVAFLDSDDLWPPDFLKRAESVLAEDPAAVAATADIRVERPQRPPRTRDLSAIERRISDVLFRDAGIGSATVLRSSAVRRAGGFPESFPTGHDLHLFCAVSALGGWRHLTGAPITKRQGFHAPGEESHLATSYADHMQRWARVYESAIDEHGERLGLDSRARAHLIGARWYRAGKVARKRGDTPAARECLRKAIRRRPFDHRQRVQLLATYFP